MRAPGVGVISHGLLTRRLSRPFAQSDGHARPGHVVRPPCDDSRRIHGFDEPPWLKEVLSALTWNALLLPVCKRDPSTPEPAAMPVSELVFPFFIVFGSSPMRVCRKVVLLGRFPVRVV